ncbi:flippase [Cyclobacterium sp. SYSU L10401]|uniref:flippase n=1 Tax=Cyclobacterium sp. SYSU L10401 TaxID=2678657 RepID=UPI0013D6667B|nr:flippase [Cyclobacterium sp. SYSU L10401]
MSKFISDFLAVFKSKAFNIILALLTGIIYARVLGPEGSGILAGVIIYPTLFVSFATLGLRQAAVYYVGKEIKPVDTVFSTIITVWLFTSGFAVVSCIYLLQYLAGNEYSPLMIGLAVAAIPFEIFKDYSSGILLGKNNIKKFATITWLPSLFRLTGALLFVWWLGWGVAGALIAPLLAMMLMAGLMFYFLKPYLSFTFSFDWELSKSMLQMGIVFAIALFVINLNYKVDQILLERLSSAYELGIYEKGVTLVEKVWQIPMLLGTIIFAGSANAKDSKVYSLKVAKLLRVSLLVTAAVLLVVALAAPLIVTGFYGRDFLPSGRVIQFLALGILFMVCFKVLNMDLAGRGKPWLSLQAMGPAVLVNIVLNYLLIPEYGAMGVALASAISYTLAAFLFVGIYSRNTGLTLKNIFAFQRSDFEVLEQKIRKKIR